MNGRSITACAVALGFLAVSGRVALAQGRGQDRRPDSTREGPNGANSQGGRTFNDQDRQVTRDWYQQNRPRLGAGWRDEDRLSPVMQGRLRPGQQLDPQLRQQMYWLPPELSQRYGPAPRGYRYAIIGGNIVMLDDTYQVRDVFNLDVQIGGRGSNDQNGWQDNDGWGSRQRNSFSDQDRRVTRDWYQQNQARLGPGWRQRDHLSRAMEGRIHRGQRLDPRLRRQTYRLPAELSRQFGPAPRGFRYAVLGGNVLMLDAGYTVWDIFRLDVQLR
jgi:hypothetical protein